MIHPPPFSVHPVVVGKELTQESEWHTISTTQVCMHDGVLSPGFSGWGWGGVGGIDKIWEVWGKGWFQWPGGKERFRSGLFHILKVRRALNFLYTSDMIISFGLLPLIGSGIYIAGLQGSSSTLQVKHLDSVEYAETMLREGIIIYPLPPYQY